MHSFQDDYAIGILPVCTQYVEKRDEYRDAQALVRAPNGGCGYAEGYKNMSSAIRAATKECAESNRVNANECRVVFAR